MRAVKLHILKTRRGYNFLAHRFIVITPLLTTNYDRVKWISFIQLCEINFPFQRYTLLDSWVVLNTNFSSNTIQNLRPV